MGQRMRSLQNQVVDIAPEQYQKLRQDFLNSLTVEMLNQDRVSSCRMIWR